MKSYNRAPRVRGVRSLVALLPNGRMIWLNMQSQLVTTRELDRITESIDQSWARHIRALRTNKNKARQFARIVKRDAAKLNQLKLKQDKALGQQISDGDARLGRRVDELLLPAIRKATVDRNKQTALFHSRMRRQFWNQLVLLSAAPLMVAYGQRSNPLAENNLVISLSLGVWLFGDEIADWFSAKRNHKNGSARGLDIWTYTAPLANLLTGWWLLNGRQHHRFITGTTNLEEALYRAGHLRNGQCQLDLVVDLSAYIAPEHLPDFKTFEQVPALATIRSKEFASATAVEPVVSLHQVSVVQDKLWIIVRVSKSQLQLKQLEIAWVVDTQKPSVKREVNQGSSTANLAESG